MKTARPAALLARLVLALALAPAALAQWDPPNGAWSKSHPDDLRVMTWNVEDGLCSTNDKVEGLNDWCALARIVAALRPDVLIVQEAGDNAGNGTGGGVDSVPNLATTLELFLHGGNDPFTAGNPPVTAFVQKYAPAYDLPHVFVSVSTDGFNRNLILSRHPFADLNGDGLPQRSDTPFMVADAYAPGPNGGIRGFQHAEIDLPDALYAGDLLVGNSHLKAGGGSGDHQQRVTAAKNIAYFLDYLYNGAGTGVPDPNGAIFDQPPATKILSPQSLIVTGGDWNEDEVLNGSTKGPADWIVKAEFADPGGNDGPDRDRSDLALDGAKDVFSGASNTQGSSKLDYVAWQDSVASLRRAFLFNTLTMPSTAWPPEIQGFPSPIVTSTQASDHRPVIVDLVLPSAKRLKPAFGGLVGSTQSTGGIVP